MPKGKHKRRGRDRGGSKPRTQSAGVLEIHRDGYGFLRPDDTDQPDVYVSGHNMADAMHRDRVLVRITRRKRGNRLEGEVVRVLERRTTRVIGVFNGSMVVPRDERMRDAVWIEPEHRAGAKRGEVVVAKITRYPSGSSGAGGLIEEILGQEGDPEVEIRSVLYEHGFRDTFPDEVTELAAKTPTRVMPSDLEGRKDLRDILFVTIDPATARDFDDAVAIQKTKAGYTLWVSIADVSHYVPPMGGIDLEAYTRATSVYFPDRAFPMLPHELSSGICSLNPKTNRLAMTAEMKFDLAGKRKGFRFYASVIKSRCRLNYEEVRKIIVDRDPGLMKKYSGTVRSLEMMRELAELRIRRREDRGSVDLDLPEAEIVFGPDGRVETIRSKERNIAHRLVEEFMLAANEAVADYMAVDPGLFVYRVHEPPPPDAVETLDQFLGGLGLRLLGKNQTPDRIRPKDYQRVLKATQGRRYEAAVNMLCLRSMTLARYDTRNYGHFGLAAERYCHFTSPIRRYPDLIVHRLLKARLSIPAPEGPAAPAELAAASEHSSERERAAEDAEREMQDYYAAELMAEKTGEEFEGTVSGLTGFGIFVQLDEPYVEGMILTETLSGPRAGRGDVVFDEKSHTVILRGRKLSIMLGDRVRVRVEDVDRERKQIDFGFISKL